MSDPLEPIWAALRRGTPRSKLRVIAVVCPNDHTLVEVYRGVDRQLVALVRDRIGNYSFIRRLGEERPPDWRTSALEAVRYAECRCGMWTVDPVAVDAAIAARRRRLVMDRRVDE